MVEHVTINRAAVLTLWASVVAERPGYDRAAALTLGKAVADVTAQAQGRRLGINEARNARGAQTCPAHVGEAGPINMARTAVTAAGVKLRAEVTRSVILRFRKPCGGPWRDFLTTRSATPRQVP